MFYISGCVRFSPCGSDGASLCANVGLGEKWGLSPSAHEYLHWGTIQHHCYKYCYKSELITGFLVDTRQSELGVLNGGLARRV